MAHLKIVSNGPTAADTQIYLDGQLLTSVRDYWIRESADSLIREATLVIALDQLVLELNIDRAELNIMTQEGPDA